MTRNVQPQLKQRQKMSLSKKILIAGGVSVAVIAAIVVITNLATPKEAYATSTGSKDPASNANVGSGRNWQRRARAYTSNNSWAYTGPNAGGGVSKYLALTNFSVSVPSGATIDGITVEIERSSDYSNDIEDYDIYLTKDGTNAVGSDYAKSGYWGTSDATETYGGTSDLWGTTWTDSEVNASTFGVLIKVQNDDPSNQRWGYIDDVNITVEYTAGGGGGGGSTGPGGITSDLELWLDANKGVTGTTQISTWADQSGNSNDATMSTSTYRPSLETDYINSNDAIDFDGGDEYMGGSTGGYTDDIFMVFVPDANITYASSGSTPLSIDADHSTPSAWIGFGASTSGLSNEVITWGVGGSSDWRRGYTSTSATYSSGEPMIVNIVNNNGSSSTSIYHNQTQIANASNGSYVSAENDEAYRIGGNCYYWGGEYYDGKIAEVITFSDDLTSANRTKVATYLGIKYGITVEDDYVLSDATTVWDQSSNSSYHYDVTGVARDDDSDLDQQKSKSENDDAAITIDKGAAFGTDLDAIIWGNNNGAQTLGSSNGSTNYPNASNRTWKVELNGTPGTVSIDIDLSTLNMTGGAAGDYALLIDSDGNFTSGSSEHTTGASLNGSVLTFTGVSFTDGYYFTLGSDITVVDGDPGGVSSNLALWLKADAGVTGTTNITAWADNSGNGYDASDASSTTRPNLDEAAINYNDAINFDGVDEYLQGTNGGYTDEVFMVMMPNANVSYTSSSQVPFTVDANNPSTASAFVGLGSATSGLTNEVVCWGAGGSSEWRRGHTSTSTTYAQDEPFLLRVSNNNTSSATAVYVNGTSVANASNGSYETAENDVAYRVGGNVYSWGGSYYNGRVAEVVSYSSTLSSSNINQVESYLALKYGITIADDYTNSSGTIIWNDSDNSTFHNRITFIGRDDDSELDQRQGKSMHDPDNIMIIGHGSIETANDDNTNSFSADNSYTIMGDNDGVLTGAFNPDYGTTTNGHAINGRIHRTWKVHESGNVGTIRFKIDMSTFPGVSTYVGSYDFSEIRLLIDSDNWFTSGAYGLTPTTYDAVEETVEFEYDFSAGTHYVSIGTIDEWGDAPLPVDFTYFKASLIAEGVKLSWGTGMEKDNEYFAVERSQDGQSWEEVGQIEGAGNSDVAMSYELVDPSPFAGTSYYRVRQVDFDGSSETTDIESVHIGDADSEELTINALYPNPFQNQLTIDFTSPQSGLATLELINLSGAVIRTRQISSNEGMNTYTWYLGDVERGNYLVRITTDALSVRKKVIKN